MRSAASVRVTARIGFSRCDVCRCGYSPESVSGGRGCGRIPGVTRAGASLARLGLTGSWAEATLTQLGWWVGDRPADGAENVMWALARSPDPDLALRAAE